jgi:hypothetical protein
MLLLISDLTWLPAKFTGWEWGSDFLDARSKKGSSGSSLSSSQWKFQPSGEKPTRLTSLRLAWSVRLFTSSEDRKIEGQEILENKQALFLDHFALNKCILTWFDPTSDRLFEFYGDEFLKMRARMTQAFRLHMELLNYDETTSYRRFRCPKSYLEFCQSWVRTDETTSSMSIQSINCVPKNQPEVFELHQSEGLETRLSIRPTAMPAATTCPEFSSWATLGHRDSTSVRNLTRKMCAGNSVLLREQVYLDPWTKMTRGILPARRIDIRESMNRISAISQVIEDILWQSHISPMRATSIRHDFGLVFLLTVMTFPLNITCKTSHLVFESRHVEREMNETKTVLTGERSFVLETAGGYGYGTPR